MRVYFELNFGRNAGALDQLLQAANSKRRSALGDENERGLSRAL
jgi:hypothetical protein